MSVSFHTKCGLGLPDVRGQGQWSRVPGCDGAGTAKRSYPASEVGGNGQEEIPPSEARGRGWEEPPASEVRGGTRGQGWQQEEATPCPRPGQ